MVFKQNMSFNKKKKSLHKLKISDKSKKNKAAKSTSAVIPDLTAAISDISEAVSKLQESAEECGVKDNSTLCAPHS